MEKGHTKFSPDRHFGTMKSKYNKTDKVETFYDCIDVVKESSRKNLVKDLMKDKIVVYDWEQFFSKYY